ncbi:nucleotidyltransferase domain-containing protein [Thermosynechococcus sp. TG252]|uniref:nucleotidyltransferase domain-containing protein n=1 Tax=Thermosynechococcus sp. TG252 TaxID=3074097 RepID=UPI00285EC8C5|nr:nucleotidyltransferase domain-containing protein [Thermosynechococcus sp. TG252]MDR7994258.1 nucleotidyltransferase domain-containing protein [Thermosynechococcus sp. TG252]
MEKAILFGSCAKGMHPPGSDIDLALVGEGLDIDTLGRLGYAFEESSIPYHMDLVWLATVDHPPLLEHIERLGQLLYERKPVSSRQDMNPCAD